PADSRGRACMMSVAPWFRRTPTVLACSIAALLASGCAKVPHQSALMRTLDARTAPGALRATENALAVSVPGEIETSADEIIARADDPAIRRQAMQWKLEAIPAYYQTLFQVDSLAAAMDTVVLAIQLEDYLSQGAGRDRFGGHQHVALEAARKNRAHIVGQMS